MDQHPAARRTPGIPGILGEFQWVDSPEYGGDVGDRRGLVAHDVDPAPLARLVAVKLGIIDGDLGEAARAVAEDERDGPIHMAHLLAACQYGAVRTGGSMGFVARGPAGEPFTELCEALLEGGQAAAAAAAKMHSPADRATVLEVLLSYLVTPLAGLTTDLRDDMLQAAR
jgi:hypothetical protein